ncbi:MAG: NAD(P)H-binding protein, partial [Myxococcales bacterium]
MTRVLLTGAAGVVGRLAVPMLLERGYAVTAVGRTVEKRARLAALGADALALDLFDGKSACAAMKRHDAVINLATLGPEVVAETV